MDETETPRARRAESLVEAAVAHHRAGRLDAAEPLYLEALQTAPGQWRAAHNLGAIYLAQGLPTRALSFLKTAFETAPDKAAVWVNYARGLINMGEYERAEQLLADQAGDPHAPAVELRLRQAWGAARMKAVDAAAAEVQFRRALALSPDDAGALGDLGYALTVKGDFTAAEPLLRRAVELAPEMAGVRLNLGSTLMRLGRWDEAEAEYRAALALEPDSAAAVQNLKVLLEKMGRTGEAQALRAEAGPLKALAAKIRAEGLYKRGRYEEALVAFDAAIGLAPQDAGVLVDRAFLRLMIRDFEGGWRDYEARWRLDRFVDASTLITTPPIHLRFDPALAAADLAGKRVLLICEQGIGDHVMFASIVPDLMATAAKLTLVCDARLVRLFRASFPGVEVTGPEEADIRLSDFDHVVPMGSLARMFRNAEADFPRTPYLRPAPEALARWADRLGPKGTPLRIGVSWRGGVNLTGKSRRSLALEEMAPILDLPGCEFVSLQYGEVADEVGRFNAGRARPVRIFPKAEIDDFEDLAALVLNLDAVVSVQTALVHLCGGLGQTCLTLIPAQPEWRYTARGETMPWYGAVRLFRQPAPDDWATPLARIAGELKRMGGG